MNEKFLRFLEKIAKEGVREEEHAQFQEWLNTAPEHEILEALEIFPDLISKTSKKTELPVDLINKIENSLNTVNSVPPRVVLWPKLHVAAIAILLVGIAGLVLYFLYNQNAPETRIAEKKQQTGVIQSVNSGNATLTLADGRTIRLDSAGEGLLAFEPGARVRKTTNGQIIYDASSPDSINSLAYNTVTTAKGKQFQITLPDGTKVWLNAGTSLKFPTAFSIHERSVELNGEAYFEVAPNKKKPFRVYSGKQTVEVLGTHFNINAYIDDEEILTTLIEGSVKLSDNNGEQSQILQPGQQANFKRTFKVLEVDPYKAIGWKNGYLNFSHETIHTVMKKIMRWYDVEVQYKGAVSKERFFGQIYRFENVSETLKMLEHTGSVHFKLDGRVITVLP